MENANGVITKNVTGLWADKATSSEQVTQAIMGQPVLIEKEEDDWLWVQTWDTYHGWVPSRNVGRIVPRPEVVATVTSMFTDALIQQNPFSEICTKLVVTTALEVIGDKRNLKRVGSAWALEMQGGPKDVVHVSLPDGTKAWVLSQDVSITPGGEEALPLGPDGKAIVQTAKRFLGVPYLWGGSSPFGIDCSGFAQLSYRLNGIGLLRDAHMQAEDPRAISVERENLQAADMVFFASGQDKTKITHVGLACGDGRFIHARGQGHGVVYNNLTDEPFNTNYWGARRMP